MSVPHAMRRAAAGGASGLTAFANVDTSLLGSVTPADHTGVLFGAADTFRYLIAVITNGNSRSVSSVVIGGVAASIIVTSMTGNQRVSMYIAAVPTGTSGTVTVTYSGSPLYSNVRLYRMVHSSYTAPYDTVPAGHSSGVVDLPIDTQAGGALLAATQSNNGGTATWANITEDYDVDISANDYFSTAMTFPTSTATALAVSMTSSDTTPGALDGVAVSFA